jgi:predicted protein tyrosine phosphatase
MKRILLKSVYDAFDYVMDHYYPAGMEDMAARKDSYAVISIQDTHTEGFGFVFKKSRYCRDVLTLYFDDIVREVEDAVLFSDEQAEAIIDFIIASKDAETLLVHCYGGESRSRAVAAFAAEMLGGSGDRFLEGGRPNTHVYDVLTGAWIRRKLSDK